MVGEQSRQLEQCRLDTVERAIIKSNLSWGAGLIEQLYPPVLTTESRKVNVEVKQLTRGRGHWWSESATDYGLTGRSMHNCSLRDTCRCTFSRLCRSLDRCSGARHPVAFGELTLMTLGALTHWQSPYSATHPATRKESLLTCAMATQGHSCGQWPDDIPNCGVKCGGLT